MTKGQQGSFYPTTTKQGYDLYEVASAFQKAIRRGDEETAMFFAVELYNTGFDEYLWKRIRIITSEDIGLAEPALPASIYALYQNYVDQKKRKDAKHPSERLFLTHAVLLLCRAKKSRLVDWTNIAFWNEHDRTHMAIPDYAYDKHNRKGRIMGRGLDHFYDEGTRLDNYADVPGEAVMKERARRAQEVTAWHKSKDK